MLWQAIAHLIKAYFSLTKPGIIFGNLISAVAGFFLATRGRFSVTLFIATVCGLSFVIASACVFNNIKDRDIDAHMARTKKRMLLWKRIPVRNAVFLASCLVITGLYVLALFANMLTAVIAFVGFIFYVFVYTYGKRVTEYGTVLGSIAGAVPPVVGYCAVANRIDTAAILLFFILVFWQMPHFYAIALYRLTDYMHAKIPVLPVRRGIATTKIHILFYIVAFMLVTVMLSVLRYTGFIFFLAVCLLGVGWLTLSIRGFWVRDNRQWGRRMFIYSLIILLSVCLLITLDR